LRAFDNGFVQGTVAAVESSVHAITRPVETIEGVVNAVVNYDQVIEALEQQWDKLMWQAANDLQAFAESVARFIGELEAGMVIHCYRREWDKVRSAGLKFSNRVREFRLRNILQIEDTQVSKFVNDYCLHCCPNQRCQMTRIPSQRLGSG